MSKNDVYEVVLRPMRAVLSPPQQAAAKPDEALEQYADALHGFDKFDLETGWTRVRDTNTRGFWPPIGVLVEACIAARKHRLDSLPKREVLHGRIIDGEYQTWGGACQCRRCEGKTPREGFWRALREYLDEVEPINHAARDWFAYQIERLPAVRHGETMRGYRLRLASG